MGRELAARRWLPDAAARAPIPALEHQRGAGSPAAGAIDSSAVMAGASNAATNASGAGLGSVGKPPATNGRPPQVAPLFEQPGLLTPKGKFVVEPAFQFGYYSSNRVALVGYTVIPALLNGLVDVREVKRNTATAILSGRYGLGKRFEVEARIPSVYRSDSTVSREIFTGTAVENVFSTSGKGVGDAEVAMHYQINQGGPDKPNYVGSLRIKSRTGRAPFEVVTDCPRRGFGDNASGTDLPRDLPTGSGFYSIPRGLTWLFPTDPAVLFGSISYRFNFGMGLGLNDKASLSIGYDHTSIARTRQGGLPVPGSVRTSSAPCCWAFRTASAPPAA